MICVKIRRNFTKPSNLSLTGRTREMVQEIYTWTWNTSGNEEKNVESLDESEFIDHCTLKSDCFKWHIQPHNIIKIIYRYLHSFLGDKPDYFQVLCNSLTYASIGCRKLFRLQCTLGLHMRGIGHRTHTERRAHYRSCRLQTVGNAHWGKD